MADVRVFTAVTDVLGKLTVKHGAEAVLEIVEAWVAYMKRIQEIVERYEGTVPDTPEGLEGNPKDPPG